jgi:hypothetical protein
MFLVGLFQWWYGKGWVSQATSLKTHLASTAAFFSIGELSATLFAPFRQISSGSVDGSLQVQIRAFLDKTLSRCIGAFVRLATIFFGILVVVVRAVYEAILLIGWGILPILPLIGFILLAIGWTPQWI